MARTGMIQELPSFGLWQCTALRDLNVDMCGLQYYVHTDRNRPRRIIEGVTTILLADFWPRPQAGPTDLTLTIDLDSALELSCMVSRSFADVVLPYLDRGLSAVRLLKGHGTLDASDRAAVAEILEPLQRRGALVL